MASSCLFWCGAIVVLASHAAANLQCTRANGRHGVWEGCGAELADGSHPLHQVATGDILLQVATGRSSPSKPDSLFGVGAVVASSGSIREEDGSAPARARNPKEESGSIISRVVGSDLLGDSLSATKHGAGELVHENEESHGYVAIFYLFITIAMGAALAFVQVRWVNAVPYTCMLFVAGGVLGYLHFEHPGIFSQTYHDSIDVWAHITPHMLFYVFLPCLIFGDAMRLNTQLLRKCLPQVLLLAGPGVLIGTGLTAVFAKYVFPYPWSWPVALVFGAILAATDPVAVLALFKEVGVSPRLTMVVAGESLLNDGTAMVVFQLMLKIAVGAQTDAYGVVIFFLNMTITSFLVGSFIGFLAVFCIGLCAEKNYHHDSMIQVVITICCAYLSYFVSEHEFSASGILATVAAGVVVANYAWPRFVNRELVDHVWEAIEFIGNTVIFFLAGLIFANKCRSRQDHIGLVDVGYLLVLYAAATVVRAVMLGILWCPLNCLGKPLGWEEGVTMVWSGLRGAIGLTMAIIVDRDQRIEEVMGSRIMFHVGGMAALTTLINASTCAPLLRWLGLTKTPRLKERLLSKFAEHVTDKMRKDFAEKLKATDDARFNDASEPMVRAMVPMLATGGTTNLDEEQSSPEAEIARIVREVFIRNVQSHYWKAIEEGVVPRTGAIAQVLLHSSNEAMDNTDTCLNDWQSISAALDNTAGNIPFLSRIKFFNGEQATQVNIVVASLSFQQAHANARKEIPPLFGAGNAKDKKVENEILAESLEQCKQAAAEMQKVPADIVEIAKSKMLARQLLHVHTSRVEHMEEGGLLTAAESAQLAHEVDHEVRRILCTPKEEWIKAKQHGGSQSGTWR